MDEQLQDTIRENQDVEEKVNVETALNKSDTDHRQNLSALEFHNCIILYGNGDINTLINEGTVNGNIVQDSVQYKMEEAVPEKKTIKYNNFESESQIKEFIYRYASEKKLCTFISVAFLKCIPDFLLIEIQDLLFGYLHEKKEKEENSAVKSLFFNIEDELETLHMISVPAECVTKMGRVQAKCVLFFDEKLAKNVVKIIWEQFLEIKSVIFKWLLELKRMDEINETMAYQISTALGETILYDWPFFQRNVCALLVQEKGNHNRSYLVNALSYYLKNSTYNAVFDKLIQEWITKKDEFLWEVVYRLYGLNKEYRFNNKIEEQLKEYFINDKKWRCLGEGIYHSRWNARVDIFPAYFHKGLQQLIMMILKEMYEQCTTYIEKTEFANYFVWLLTMDYKLEGYPCFELLFVSCLRQKEVRQKVRKMYLELWERYNVKRIWTKILEKHFVELETRRKPWKYMQDFFKTMAFTGRKEAFEEMQEILEKMRSSKYVASEVKTWLLERLQERKG